MTFTDLETLTTQSCLDLEFLLNFLENSNMFVNTFGSEGWLCGGLVWAIGWHKEMTELESVG